MERIMSIPSQLVVEALEARDLLDLVLDVCRRRGVLLDELCGRLRSQSIAGARHEAWWRIRHHPERAYSLSEIARLFGRDPSTVLAGVRAHAHHLREPERSPEVT
jgi:chromosomal replication initiation ATPase DnaA